MKSRCDEPWEDNYVDNAIYIYQDEIMKNGEESELMHPDFGKRVIEGWNNMSAEEMRKYVKKK